MGREEVALPTLDPIAHTYTLDGKVVPGVTSILAANGFYEFPFVSPADLAHASQRGRDVHLAAELHDRGELDYTTITDEVAPYFEGWLMFRSHHPELEIIANEQILFHRGLFFAGTLDRVFRRGKTKILGDIKTGMELPAAALQTSAYQAAYNERLPATRHLTKRASIHLTATGKFRYVEHDNPQDFRAFCAALTLYNWRKNNG